MITKEQVIETLKQHGCPAETLRIVEAIPDVPQRSMTETLMNPAEARFWDAAETGEVRP